MATAEELRTLLGTHGTTRQCPVCIANDALSSAPTQEKKSDG
jgi:hypothetical protein